MAEEKKEQVISQEIDEEQQQSLVDRKKELAERIKALKDEIAQGNVCVYVFRQP